MVALSLPDIDSRKLSFGKYKGMSPDEIGDVNPCYVVWMYENIDPPPCSKELYLACESAAQDDDHTEDSASALKW